MRKLLLTIATLFSIISTAQSNIESAVKGGELILSGLTVFKMARSNPKSSKTVPSLCVKNKLADKITFKISGIDTEKNDVKKELVIPKEGKECLLEVPKGIYTYEIVKSNNEIYKKGEYKLEEEITIVVKDE